MKRYSVLTGAAAMALASNAVALEGMAKGKNETAEREPVTATGNDLLKLLAENGGTMMLTQAEGASIVESGFATVNTDNVEGDTAEVSLTEAGNAAVAALTNGSSRAAGFEVDDGVEMPNTPSVRRGRSGGYPFETLEIGQSVHVPATPNNPDPLARLQSSVSGARAKFAEETDETETYTKKTYKRGEDGKFIKDEEGKRVIESEEEATRPVKRFTRDFVAKAVDESDPRGPGARVWRVELS